MHWNLFVQEKKYILYTIRIYNLKYQDIIYIYSRYNYNIILVPSKILFKQMEHAYLAHSKNNMKGFNFDNVKKEKISLMIKCIEF